MMRDTGSTGGDSGGHQHGKADDHREEIESRIEFRTRVANLNRTASIDSGHARHTLGALVVLLEETTYTGASTNDALHQRHQARHGHQDTTDIAHALGGAVERCAGEQDRSAGHDEIGSTKEPAVTEADLTMPSGEPTTEHSADRPLQEHGGRIELNHGRHATTSPHLRDAP
jgi:hypothetical protein